MMPGNDANAFAGDEFRSEKRREVSCCLGECDLWHSANYTQPEASVCMGITQSYDGKSSSDPRGLGRSADQKPGPGGYQPARSDKCPNR